jgi:hypothetical protein
MWPWIYIQIPIRPTSLSQGMVPHNEGKRRLVQKSYVGILYKASFFCLS